MKKIGFWMLLLLMIFGSVAIPCTASFLGRGGAVLAADTQMIKTGLVGERMIFTDTDFKEALATCDLRAITIESLPRSTDGTLLFSGRRVTEGEVIKRKDIGALVFIPASKNVTECKFKFSSDRFNGGEPVECTLKFIDRINYAPTISTEKNKDLSVWTQSGISVFGRMSASDPEGDECEFTVLTYPKRGTLTVTDRTTGEYRYTPGGSFTGKDSFCYVVRDCYGNFSAPCTVDIRVDGRRSDVFFTDLSDSPYHNAAIVMSDLSLLSGKPIGDGMYFMPNETVSRAEFVAMAMKLCGIRPDTTLNATFFDDNDSIPTALVGYVATAQRLGIVNGAFDGKQLNFRPTDAITVREAAIVLARLVGTESVTPSDPLAELVAGVPLGARDSVYTMYRLGVFDRASAALSLGRSLTRGEAAELLFRVYTLT